MSRGHVPKRSTHRHANQWKDPHYRLPPVSGDRRVRVAPVLGVAPTKGRHGAPTPREGEPGQERAVVSDTRSEDQTCVTMVYRFAAMNRPEYDLRMRSFTQMLGKV